MKRLLLLLCAASCLTAVGQSLSFDGVDDWVEAPSINLTGSPFNIEGWIQVPPVTFADQTNIIDNYVFGSGGSDRWGVYVGGAEESGGQFAGQLYAPTFDIQPSENGLRIDDNEWHHFAVQRNELGESSLYIDGLLVNSGSCALDYNLDAGFPTRINGGYHCGGGTQCRFMTCDIADIQVSLSVKYVSAFSADCQILTAPDAVLHYAFDDASNGYVADLSGSENDGIIYGAISSEEEPECSCSDAMACNYNESEPCHYDCNFCLEGTIWSEELGGCIVANPADINLDGCVQLNDLLDLLSAYGDCAAEESAWQCGDLLEYQGYDYETVQIGEQCWFAENARYLPSVSPSNFGWEDDGGAHAYIAGYEGTSVEEAKTQNEYDEYGTLYNFVSVQESLMCPQGWHVPSLSEWDVLKGSIGISSAYKLKSPPPVWDGTNELGFNAIRVPVRTSNGSFTDYSKADFWTSTSIEDSDNAWGQELNTGDDTFTDDPNGKGSGNPIRCIKDAE